MEVQVIFVSYIVSIAGGDIAIIFCLCCSYRVFPPLKKLVVLFYHCAFFFFFVAPTTWYFLFFVGVITFFRRARLYWGYLVTDFNEGKFVPTVFLGVMLGRWLLFVIASKFLLMELVCFWYPSSIRWSSSLWKYAISSSVLVFTQSDSGSRYATFGIWIHFSFNILLACNSFWLRKLFSFFLGKMPETVILICFYFSRIKVTN